MVEPTERWFEILSALALPDVSPTQHVLTAVLSRAIQSVQHDEQWNVSGIPELLARAREMADLGSHAAWRTAVSLLDFHRCCHRMVEKHRSHVTLRPCQESSYTDELTSSSSCSDTTSHSAAAAVFGMPAALPLKRRHSDESEASCCSDGSEFAWPKLPTLEGRCRVGLRTDAAPTQPPTPRPQTQLSPFETACASDPCVWSGSLCYAAGGDDVVLADIDVPLPISLPCQSLFVSAIVPRAAVKMGKHHACRTSFQRASSAQVANLRALAAKELVVVAPLAPSAAARTACLPFGGAGRGGGGALVLVPYLDNAKALRCVTFLLNSAPAVVAPLCKQVAQRS